MSLSPAIIPTGNISSFIQAVNGIPFISQEEEFRLASKLRNEGCVESAQKLVTSHLRFVLSISRKYFGYGLPKEDIIQEGTVGLMKAVRGFNPELGYRLSTFAVQWIRSEIHDYLLKNWSLVKIATTKAQRKLFFNLRKLKGDKDFLSDGDVGIIAATLSVSESDVRSMDVRLSSRDISFDPIEVDDEPSSPVLYLADQSRGPEDLAIDEDSSSFLSSKLVRAISQLDDRSRDIIKLRRMNEGEIPTLSDLSKKYGVSVERVRQLEAAAIKKLKCLMEE
jgi:RNA polymerase sigma-32 factor